MSTYHNSKGTSSHSTSPPRPPNPPHYGQSPNPPHHGQAYPGAPYPGGAYDPPTGPPQGNQGPLIPPPRPQQIKIDDSITLAQMRKFITNQPVQVNIQGHGWLVGTVVAVLNLVKAISGTHVRVRYTDSTRQWQDEQDFPNNPQFILPYNPDPARPYYG